VEELSDEQLRRPVGPIGHAIAFEVWHLARWADHLQTHLPSMNADLGRFLGKRQEVRATEGLATKWGFSSSRLGYDETGMLMGDDAAAALSFPAKDVVLDYARRAFAAADEAVGALDEQLLTGPNEPELQQQSITNSVESFTVADAVLSHVAHDNRHLG
jgi:hypothetical protein